MTREQYFAKRRQEITTERFLARLRASRKITAVQQKARAARWGGWTVEYSNPNQNKQNPNRNEEPNRRTRSAQYDC